MKLVAPFIACLIVSMVMPVESAAIGGGDIAPDFVLESTEGTVSLEDYRGRKHVVLAFYIQDFTPT